MLCVYIKLMVSLYKINDTIYSLDKSFEILVLFYSKLKI